MTSRQASSGAAVEALTQAVRDLIGPTPATWPGGWPNEVESALIDAVFSIRARYGSTPDVGVRAVVNRWRRERHGSADDLRQLASAQPERLSLVLSNRSRISGQLKADLVRVAAAELDAAGLRFSADLLQGDEPDVERFKRAYVSVDGLGPVTWSYFGMLLGRADVKADRWIMRFVERVGVRGRDEARAALSEVAGRLDVSVTELDHAIWAAMRRRR